MAIVEMKKFTLLSFESCKESLLKHLQQFENVHFKDLQKEELGNELAFLHNNSSRELITQYESELAKVKFAVEKLKPFIQKPKGLKAYTTPKPQLTFEDFDNCTDGFDYNQIYEIIKAQDDIRKSTKAEQNKLKADNINLSKWEKLDISPKSLDECKSIAYFLGIVSKTLPEAFRTGFESAFPASYVEILGTIKDETAVLLTVLKSEEEQAITVLKNLGFSKNTIAINDVPKTQIQANHARISMLTDMEEQASQAIAVFIGEVQRLQIAQDYYASALERAKAAEFFMKTEKVLLIEGWIPAKEESRLLTILQSTCGEEYYFEMKDVEKDSTEVPVQLKNGKLVSSFQSIVGMYAMPRYNEIDPTPLIVPFYMLFFGLMVGDIGYGLLVLIATFLVGKYFVLSDGVKDFMKFLFYLSFAIIGAGILYGSFFGITFFKPIDTGMVDSVTGAPIYKAILDTQLDIITMMIASVAIGVVQVVFGLAVKGYMLLRDGRPWSALFDSGFWIIILLSSIGMLLGATGTVSEVVASVCGWLFLAMLIGLLFTQGRENKSIAGKIGGGVYGVYGLTGYIGDLVSYTRIVALGLSGAYIAAVFNLMAGMVPVVGILIFIIGHSINLSLGVLGAYVHSCRLQYVEFFGKFYEGGGKVFKPLKFILNSVTIQEKNN